MNPNLVKTVLHYCNVSLNRTKMISRKIIDYYDLTFVLDGEMTYFANGTKIILRKNDAIFLSPGTERERLGDSAPVRYISFNFEAEEGVAFPFPQHLSKIVTQEIKNIVMNFPPSHLQPDTFSYEKCVGLLNYILFSMLENYRMESRNPHVESMVRYIRTHICDKITLKEISEQAGLSREYASYLFKREKGCTLTDYVNRQKLLLAKSMILGGEMSLADVSLALGYENYNYFSRSFKAHFGISPLQIKKQKGIET